MKEKASEGRGPRRDVAAHDEDQPILCRTSKRIRVPASPPKARVSEISSNRSPRALQRHLQSAHTTYLQDIDDLRRHFAQQYLRQPKHSIADIAFLLGFSEPSALHRSF